MVLAINSDNASQIKSWLASMSRRYWFEHSKEMLLSSKLKVDLKCLVYGETTFSEFQQMWIIWDNFCP